MSQIFTGILLISAWCVLSVRCYRSAMRFPLLFFCEGDPRITNYRGKLTIIVTAIHFIGHVSRTVESFVAPLMQWDAVAVIAHPLVRMTTTMISLCRPMVTAHLIAIVVQAIDSAIAALMLGYAIAALASPFVERAMVRSLIFISVCHQIYKSLYAVSRLLQNPFSKYLDDYKRRIYEALTLGLINSRLPCAIR